MLPAHAHRLRHGPRTHKLWPPSERGLKTAALLIGGVLPARLLADMVSKNQVAWALLIAAVTSLVALLAWRYPVATGILLVLVTLALVPSTFLGFMVGTGLAGETPHLTDYLWYVVSYPGPFLLAGALLIVARKIFPAEG